MALITWSESLSVGVKKFDDQHKILIGHLNNLHDAMRGGKSTEVMGTILGELVDYTIYHFSSEEEVFESSSYPDTEKHKAEHKAFTDKASALQKEFEAGKLFISVELLNFLIDWVQNHIQGSDFAYRKFFSDKTVE